MDWQEIRIKTRQEAVETVSNLLYELGVGGVVIEDPSLIQQYIAEEIWDYYEFPPSEAEDERVVVKAYLPMTEKLPTKMEDLRNKLEYVRFNYFPGLQMELSLARVKEEDWANSWKAYFKPEKIGEKVVIQPSWEQYQAQAGEVVIQLDPGMAFGTGNHPTTAMCIRALEKYLQGDEKVYDVGTGSGVLAIAASMLGAKEVIAVDIDEVAVKTAGENVERNHIKNVEVLQGNLLDLITEPAKIIVANIIADIIIAVCSDVKKLLDKKGVFIASGIIGPRRQDVFAAFAKEGLKVLEVFEEGDWVALVAAKEEG